MKTFKKQRDRISKEFDNLMFQTKVLLIDISANKEIVFLDNGVTLVVVDPYSDFGDMSDVSKLANGVVYLENGTEAPIEDFQNLTDLVFILKAIEE